MQGAHFLLFPELSLTGYELALARSCALAADAAELKPLRTLARDAQMTVVAGLPLINDSGALQLGALAFCPDGKVLSYAKQNLYGEEKKIFTPGDKGVDVTVGSLVVALAICADIADPNHAANAAARGANIYAAGVFETESGYDRSANALSSYARLHGISVLMANYSGTTGGQPSAGRSALWAEDGTLLASCEDDSEAILFGRETGDGGWESWVSAVH
jgi:predicted amidohydrolase